MTSIQPDASVIPRMIRAARLEQSLYEEVEHDRDATRQAALVVAGTSIAAGIGGGFALGVGGLIFITIASLVGWALYAWLTYFIGTRLLAGPGTQADWGEMARALGFANSPRALLIFGVVPALAGLLAFIVGIWVLIATVIAIREALDFSTGRAIGTAIAGWLAQGLVLTIVYALLS